MNRLVYYSCYCYCYCIFLLSKIYQFIYSVSFFNQIEDKPIVKTDIEKYIEKQIELKLNSLLETLPDKIPKDLQIKPIYNLTIKELYKNTLQTLIDIINDVVDAYSKKDYINNNNYIYILYNIFTKDNRKIYVGIMIIILSFIIYFIDGASA